MTPPRAGILLADDDRVDAKAFLRTLGTLGSGCEVTVARDGVEAWELLTDTARTPPALIVLDINMPRMDGLELLHRIREEPALHDTPVFVLTTSDDESDRYRAMQLSIAGYIVKGGLGPGLKRALALAGVAAGTASTGSDDLAGAVGAAPAANAQPQTARPTA